MDRMMEIAQKHRDNLLAFKQEAEAEIAVIEVQLTELQRKKAALQNRLVTTRRMLGSDQANAKPDYNPRSGSKMSQIAELLKASAEPMRVKDICEALNVHAGNAGAMIRYLEQKGVIKKVDFGLYAHVA